MDFYRSHISSLFAILLLAVLLLFTGGCSPRDSEPEVKDPNINITRGRDDQGVPIRLLSRTFTVDAGIDPDLQKFALVHKEESLHVIVQLTRHPSRKDMQAMQERHGIRLLDAIPEKAYFASVPKTMVAQGKLPEFQGHGNTDLLHAMVGLKPSDKILPSLLRGEVEAHAMLDDKGEPHSKGSNFGIVVLFFDDIPQDIQKAWLENTGAKILGHAVSIHAWDVMIARDKLIAMADFDGLKWIETRPGPVELDNDDVRSASGVNADAVNTTTNFGLSGAGVTLAQWEPTNASATHGDLSGNITIADAPVPSWTRSHLHMDSAPADAAFTIGEAIYADVDDNGAVSVNDQRLTATGVFAAGSTVAAADADVGTALIQFQPLESFGDALQDNRFDSGDPVYLDADGDDDVSVGDTRITAVGAFAAGSVVAAGDADVGDDVDPFPLNPHYHATHVAGTLIGTGAQSVANGGGANQWRGVASGASLMSYTALDRRTTTELGPEYTNAVNVRSVVISSNSWGSSHCHQESPPVNCYNVVAQLYDTLVSGRLSTGAASTYAQRISVFGSSGNRGRAERHADDLTANGQYDNGEAIYIDNDMSGTVDVSDFFRTGTAQAAGTALIDFQANERHNDGTNGLWNNTETIYRDADASRTVTAGDTRITVPAGSPFIAGSVVVAADADLGTFLRQFRLWGNTRIPNSAKNTVVVGNVTNDGNLASGSSSRGPTTDGRLKPDISGPGSQNAGDRGVTSAFPGNAYSVVTGTSMSTPAAAAAAALVEEWYATACKTGAPKPSTIKALLLHSAVDVAAIPTIGGVFNGPDFVYGYGMVKIDRAVQLIPHHVEGTANMTGTVSTYSFTTGTVQDLKVTLAWDDVPWNVAAAASPATGLLVNDLDLELVAPNGTVFTPWQINAAAPGTPAVGSGAGFAPAAAIPASARDKRNTVEQVVVASADPGTWTVRVIAAGLAQPMQDFSVVSGFLPPQFGPCNAAPATDVWMKDNAGDSGDDTTPTTGTLYLSPDVWNRLAEDGMTGHLNPEFGQPNYLYANLRNRSATEMAEATSINIWLARAATGLSWPDDFEFVGRFSVPNLVAGTVRQVGPLVWNPPNPVPSDHFCFYIRVVNPQDPITFVEGSSVSNNARNSNNLVWRNINVVNILSTTSVTFLTRNLSNDNADIDIEINIPEELLAVGTVGVGLEDTLARQWQQGGAMSEGIIRTSEVRVAGVPGLPGLDNDKNVELPGEPKTPPRKLSKVKISKSAFRGIPMAGRQEGAVTLTFASDSREKKVYTVDVVQRQNGEIVGGIRYLVRTGFKPGE